MMGTEMVFGRSRKREEGREKEKEKTAPGVEIGEWREERGEREKVSSSSIILLFRKIEARWVQELL